MKGRNAAEIRADAEDDAARDGNLNATKGRRDNDWSSVPDRFRQAVERTLQSAARAADGSYVSGVDVVGAIAAELKQEGYIVRISSGGEYVFIIAAGINEMLAFAPKDFANTPNWREAIAQLKVQFYNEGDPPSGPADTSQHARMGDDLNTAVKKARAQVLRREQPKVRLSALSAAYKSMLKHVDLLNPTLAEDERLRRARRLVRTYERLRKRKPNFHDDSAQLRAARSIINRFQYQGRKLKEQAAFKLAVG